MSGKLSNTSAIITIVSSTLGTGITLMPSTFYLLGNFLAFCLMAFIGFVTFFSIYSLGYVAVLSKSDNTPVSYDSLAAKFSPKLRAAVSFTLSISSLITVFVFCQMLLKIFTSTLMSSEYLSSYIDEKNSYLIGPCLFIVLALVYIPLFSLENLTSLSIFSKFSLFVAIVFSVFVSAIGLIYPAPVGEIPATTQKTDIINPLGYVIFALHCQFSFPDIIDVMENRSLANIGSVSGIASILATILYSTVGFLGYRAFGSDVGDASLILTFGKIEEAAIGDKSTSKKRDVIIRSLVERTSPFIGSTIPMLLHSSFLAIFFAGIIFCMFPVISIVQETLSSETRTVSRRSVAVMGSIFVLLSGIKKIESLGKYIGVAGFLFTTPLSFLFPAAFILYMSPGKKNLMTIGSILMVIMSVAIMIVMTYLTIKKEFF